MIDKNKPVAIVTGGSRGIGSEIVLELARNNFYVILNYNLSEQKANEIKSQFPNSIYLFQGDVSVSDNVYNLINYSYNTFGKIDLLINNAGIDLIKTINDTSPEDFEKIIRTNLFSAFYASKFASNYMIKQKNGLIINISSIWGIVGASCEVAYSISKAGMDGLTKALAKELGPSNIRVNSIAPGMINTEMNNSLSDLEKEEVINEIPLGKMGSTKDIAKCVFDLYNAPYITGQVIQINGGWNV